MYQSTLCKGQEIDVSTPLNEFLEDQDRLSYVSGICNFTECQHGITGAKSENPGSPTSRLWYVLFIRHLQPLDPFHCIHVQAQGIIHTYSALNGTIQAVVTTIYGGKYYIRRFI